MQTENEFLITLKATNKGLTRNAAISLEESYIKWLDGIAAQAGITRSRVVKQLVEEKMGSLYAPPVAGDDHPVKTTISLHPLIAEAIRRDGGDINAIINQALAQALELEVSA